MSMKIPKVSSLIKKILKYTFFIVFLLVTGCRVDSERQLYNEADKDEELLKPDRQRIDLGSLGRDGGNSFCFYVRNVSDTIVNINRIQTSCNCLVLSDKPKKPILRYEVILI